MKEGSLKHALFWIKWKMECGPEKEFYHEVYARKKRAKMIKMAKEETKFKYRYTGKEGR